MVAPGTLGKCLPSPQGPRPAQPCWGPGPPWGRGSVLAEGEPDALSLGRADVSLPPRGDLAEDSMETENAAAAAAAAFTASSQLKEAVLGREPACLCPRAAPAGFPRLGLQLGDWRGLLPVGGARPLAPAPGAVVMGSQWLKVSEVFKTESVSLELFQV